MDRRQNRERRGDRGKLRLQYEYRYTRSRIFHLAGMRVIAGREFDWQDNETARPVAIISESLSRQLFPSGEAVGKRIDYGNRKVSKSWES